MTKVKKVSSPPKWVAWAYDTFLATGRYAKDWLPELLAAYEEILHEQGAQGANDWLTDELISSFGPSAGHRVHIMFRVIFFAWRMYAKVARK